MIRRGTSLLWIFTFVCFFVRCGPAAAIEPSAFWGPSAMAVSNDGKTLLVACHEARRIAWVDVDTRRVTRSVELLQPPTGLVVHPDGKRLFVTSAGPRSNLRVVDIASGETLGTIAVGHTGMGPAISADGTTLYVCNRFENSLSVVDIAKGRETARVAVGREPVGAAVTPDDKTVVVIHHLPDDAADSYDVAATVAFVDTATRQSVVVRLPNGSTGLRQICLSPDGRYAFATHTLGNFHLVPTVVTGGWINHNVISVLDTSKKVLLDTFFLDELDMGAGNPWGVACTADGRSICIAHGGSRELSVIDAHALYEKLRRDAANAPIRGGSPYYPGILGAFGKRIPLCGAGTRSLVLAGSTAYVAGRFSDTVEVVDTRPKEPAVETIRLGPEPKLSPTQRGEMLFHDATICFQHWQSCSTCHPDARTDALNWDLLNDGVGNAKNTKSMLHSHATPPAMWTGVRESAEAGVRAGIEHTLFTERPEEEAAAIDAYLKSLRPVPSSRLVDGRLSASAERGKALFESRRIGCAACHPAPLYTDRRSHDVDTHGTFDQSARFDTPGLIECWRTAPYLHDGRHATVKALIQNGRHGNTRGQVERMTEAEVDDLVEFVLSL